MSANALNVPSNEPDAVVEPLEKAQRLTRLHRETLNEVNEGARNIDAAVQADVDAIATAAVERKEVKDPDKRERAARGAHAQAMKRLRGVAQALDTANAELAGAVDEAREAWIERLARDEQEALAEYEAALTAARAALPRIGYARNAQTFLREFDLGGVAYGRQRGWNGVTDFVVHVPTSLGRERRNAQDLLNDATHVLNGNGDGRHSTKLSDTAFDGPGRS